MAKETKMKKESQQMSDEERSSRTYMAPEGAWDGADGEEFGGSSEILKIEVGEIAGPLTYMGHQDMTTELGDTTVHLATNGEGEQLRLPIQATFIRAIEQAGVIRGDQFLVKRMDNQIKKRGKGAGNEMAIYAVKVTSRVPRAAAAA